MKVTIKNKGISKDDIYKYEMGIDYKDSAGKRAIMRPEDCLGFVFFPNGSDTINFRSARYYDRYIFARQMTKDKLCMLLYYMPESNRGNPSYNPANPGSGPMGYYSKEFKIYFLSLDDYNYIYVNGEKFKQKDREALKLLFKDHPDYYNKLEQNGFYGGDIESIVNDYNGSK